MKHKYRKSKMNLYIISYDFETFVLLEEDVYCSHYNDSFILQESFYWSKKNKKIIYSYEYTIGVYSEYNEEI